MSNPLSVKRMVERAFAVDYLPAKLAITDLNIYEGHDPAEVMEYPALIVYGASAQSHPDMPYETGTKVVSLRMQFRVDSAAGGRTVLDYWRGDLEEAFRCTSDIQAILNAPAVGVDPRTIQKIHFHDAVPSADESDRDETDWVEEMRYDIICEPLSA